MPNEANAQVLDAHKLETGVCIAGGGPAGLLCGFLLARAGIHVTVLEKHADFLRDFRGDTIHPSTMDIMDKLGLLDEFLTLPHEKVSSVMAQFGPERLRMFDLSALPVRAPYIAMMPQWDFLDFIARHGRAYPTFSLLMQTEALSLLDDGRRTTGVKARGPTGEIHVHAALTIAADGRTSVLRQQSGLPITEFGAPMDVLWFRLTRQPDDTDETQGRFDAGRIFVMLNRSDYWQCAYVIRKGGNDAIRANGLDAFRDGLRAMLPVDTRRADELVSWDQVKLLSVQVNRLDTWSASGFLCIGDAAHAMSPVAGVGVNLAVQDAVAAANLLHRPLKENRLTDADLAAVQARRAWPTKATQRLQLAVQNRLIGAALSGQPMTRAPVPARIIAHIPWLNRLFGRKLMLGFRPELPDAEIIAGRGE